MITHQKYSPKKIIAVVLLLAVVAAVIIGIAVNNNDVRSKNSLPQVEELDGTRIW